ncbi:hypothetical protein ACFX2C_004181 [Malus domestica]
MGRGSSQDLSTTMALGRLMRANSSRVHRGKHIVHGHRCEQSRVRPRPWPAETTSAYTPATTATTSPSATVTASFWWRRRRLGPG